MELQIAKQADSHNNSFRAGPLPSRSSELIFSNFLFPHNFSLDLCFPFPRIVLPYLPDTAGLAHKNIGAHSKFHENWRTFKYSLFQSILNSFPHTVLLLLFLSPHYFTFNTYTHISPAPISTFYTVPPFLFSLFLHLTFPRRLLHRYYLIRLPSVM